MSITAATPAQTVTYCHCEDCKRWTGAPAPAFAAFTTGDLDLVPAPTPRNHVPGVTRWFCTRCGSPLAAQFDYLPRQTYVPLGVLDQGADMPPALHCHAQAAYPWLHMDDGLPRADTSGRDVLKSSNPDRS